MSSRPSQPNLRSVIDRILSTPHLARNITYVAHIPAQAPNYADFPTPLDPRLREALKRRGIDKLYSHQAEAVAQVLEGKNVVVVTPTASGKTLCFNLPVLQRILTDPKRCAIYLYPTKALAQDQYIELEELAADTGGHVKFFTFDGDTPASARKAIRTAGNIILTNPDMLHTGILPNHTAWSRVFEHLDFVIIDEIHHYRGVFGSHVANVLRRLQRICEFYGAHPQYICCSATIANPKEIAEKLCEREFSLIDKSGAPTGEKFFVFYNPPVVNEALGIRRNVINEARRLATRFLADNIQTIIFARSRMRVELLVNYLKKAMRRIRQNPDRIAGYRGGYLPNERRIIERAVKSGEILGIVSTNALELGIDIGQLRAAILAGYPGSVSSTWQQAGRAGRKADTAVAVLIASSLPIDQYVVTHPNYFFGKPPEMAIVNPDNPSILAAHIKCAAFELPFSNGERFGKIDPSSFLEYLAADHLVRHVGEKWFWSADIYPSENISLRSASAENFVVVDVTDKNRVIAEIDYDSAPFLIHTEAIYMHLGEVYHVDLLDWDRRTAFVRPHKSDYYTEALAKTDIRILYEDMTEKVKTGDFIDTSVEIAPPISTKLAAQSQEYPVLPTSADVVPASRDIVDDSHERARRSLESESGNGKRASAPSASALSFRSFGNVAVITVIAKYKKLRFETHENVGYGEVNVPPLEMQTEAAWFCYDASLLHGFEQRMLDAAAGLQGVANVLTNVVPLYVLCDPKDVGVVPNLRDPHTALPTLFVYDKYPGGTGLARKVFESYATIFRAALELVEQCPCRDGCPSCVGPPLELGKGAKAASQLWLKAAVCGVD
ncbi:MAG: DEAD/DEAH box helicase [Candidatus Sumerlaeaceae bacterium]|nr:DEAD/DEAH box helicase [Candidatus Sumerlaeaceae bacterium]